MSADFETLEEAQEAEKVLKTMEFPSLPSRDTRRKGKLLGKKIMSLYGKGNTPRQIAHKLGYANIDKAEDGIKQFIGIMLKK